LFIGVFFIYYIFRPYTSSSSRLAWCCVVFCGRRSDVVYGSAGSRWWSEPSCTESGSRQLAAVVGGAERLYTDTPTMMREKPTKYRLLSCSLKRYLAATTAKKSDVSRDKLKTAASPVVRKICEQPTAALDRAVSRSKLWRDAPTSTCT
jgi:hypothetical protein